MVESLVDLEILRDIAALQAVFDAHPANELPEAIEAFRLLPQALVQWFGDVFGLSVDHREGDEFETTADRLSRFELDGNWPDSMEELVRVRVAAAGWKRGRSQLIAPQVKILEAARASDSSSIGK